MQMLLYHEKAQDAWKKEKKKWTLQVRTEFRIGSYKIPEFRYYCHSHPFALYKALKLSGRESHRLFAAIINLLGILFSDLETLRWNSGPGCFLSILNQCARKNREGEYYLIASIFKQI